MLLFCVIIDTCHFFYIISGGFFLFLVSLYGNLGKAHFFILFCKMCIICRKLYNRYIIKKQ